MPRAKRVDGRLLSRAAVVPNRPPPGQRLGGEIDRDVGFERVRVRGRCVEGPEPEPAGIKMMQPSFKPEKPLQSTVPRGFCIICQVDPNLDAGKISEALSEHLVPLSLLRSADEQFNSHVASPVIDMTGDDYTRTHLTH